MAIARQPKVKAPVPPMPASELEQLQIIRDVLWGKVHNGSTVMISQYMKVCQRIQDLSGGSSDGSRVMVHLPSQEDSDNT